VANKEVVHTDIFWAQGCGKCGVGTREAILALQSQEA
jgi:hypothetical protein